MKVCHNYRFSLPKQLTQIIISYMTIITDRSKFNILGDPKVTLLEKIEHLHCHSSRRADVFINNTGMFELFIHQEMLREALCIKYHY